jgi:hypothetical protein
MSFSTSTLSAPRLISRSGGRRSPSPKISVTAP